MKFCNQDISKTITVLCKFGHRKFDISKTKKKAKSFKLSHVIVDNLVKILKKSLFFFSYCPLQTFGIENLQSRYLKNYNSYELQTWSDNRK